MPPRSAIVAGPYTRTSGPPEACRAVVSAARSSAVSPRTCVASAPSPTSARRSNPAPSAVTARKLGSRPRTLRVRREAGARTSRPSRTRRCRRREPRPRGLPQRLAPRDESAEPGRIAEQLVEGEHGEIDRPLPQAQRAAREERGGVDQRVEPARLCVCHERQRVAYAGEVRLRREREQPGAAPSLVVERARGIDQPQLSVHGEVPHARAGATSVLAHAVDRVVVVGRRDERDLWPERVALGDELDRRRRVRGEADFVRGGVDVEDREGARARASSSASVLARDGR